MGQPGLNNKRFCIHTLGCRVNQYESDAIASQFRAAGWTECDPQLGEPVEIAIVHTCGVTAEAMRKSGQILRRMRDRFHAHFVVAIGCQVELLEGESEADLALGNRKKNQAFEEIVAAYENFLSSEAKIADGERGLQQTSCSDPAFSHRSIPYQAMRKDLIQSLKPSLQKTMLEYSDFGYVSEQKGTRAYIKVQDGCDMRCSYCAIHMARGASRSRSLASVLLEAKSLIENSYRDLVLTGIEVSAYGYDLADGSRLIDLIERLDEVEGYDRLLLGSLDPRFTSESCLKRLAKLQHFGPHFHLALQSGSSSVLKRMRRAYSAEFYREAVQRIYHYFPEANLTTDIICGFPGETREEHFESLEFCREQRFSDFHVFPYSDRPLTEASRMPDKIRNQEKKARLQDFLKLREEAWLNRAKRELGQVHQLLIETEVEHGYQGYSKNYLPIRLETDVKSEKIGQIVDVEISDYDDKTLRAKLKSEYN